MTYSCTKPNDLHDLCQSVEKLIKEFKEKLPKSDGLILRPSARKIVQKKAKKILRKYRSLPKYIKKGKQKGDWYYQHRVGQKASKLRKKVCKYTVHVHELYITISFYTSLVLF